VRHLVPQREAALPTAPERKGKISTWQPLAASSARTWSVDTGAQAPAYSSTAPRAAATRRAADAITIASPDMVPPLVTAVPRRPAELLAETARFPNQCKPRVH
jgi:hypothetical protein